MRWSFHYLRLFLDFFFFTMPAPNSDFHSFVSDNAILFHKPSYNFQRKAILFALDLLFIILWAAKVLNFCFGVWVQRGVTAVYFVLYKNNPVVRRYGFHVGHVDCS